MKVIRPHDPAWPLLFAAEAEAIAGALGEALRALHHIGSTAVPELVAKPVIDMLGEAASLEAVDARAGALRGLGYDVRGEHGISGRRYFSKAAREGVGFHLHVYAASSPQIARHVRFRDYLRSTPEAAQAYAALKRTLADNDGVLVPDYAERKAAFIQDIDQRALARAVRP